MSTEISFKLQGQKAIPSLVPRGQQISQDEFIARWGECSWPNQDVNTLNPNSGYFCAAGELSRYSGVKDWYRPALWWEWLIVLTWGRLFWFSGKRWEVWVEDYQYASCLSRHRLRLVAWFSTLQWLVHQRPRGTLTIPGRGLWLYDRMIGTRHDGWLNCRR